MRNCLLCPKGTRCRGYVLHTLVLKLYDAMTRRAETEAIVRQLSREDMEMMAELGGKARETCWGKAFVLVVGRKVADIAKTTKDDTQMRNGIERMIVQMDGLFTKLPKGVSVDLSEMAMEVFNQACTLLDEEGSGAFVPANVVGQACAAVNIKKMEKAR